jgi:hypothetical protein
VHCDGWRRQLSGRRTLAIAHFQASRNRPRRTVRTSAFAIRSISVGAHALRRERAAAMRLVGGARLAASMLSDRFRAAVE